MDEERRGGISIERGTVKEKRMRDGTFWWEYRVESLTRDGLISLWMQSIDVWEHVKMPEIGGNQQGYAVDTKVYFFLFEDGYGLILNRIRDTAEDYQARIGVFVDIMALVIEKENLILDKLAELKAQITDATSTITGAIGDAKSDITGAIGSAKSDITGAIGDAKSDITGAIGDAKGDITDAIGEVKDVCDEINGKV